MVMIIFAILLKLVNTCSIGNLGVSSNSLQNTQTHLLFISI